jgi:hypothetical protein
LKLGTNAKESNYIVALWTVNARLVANIDLLEVDGDVVLRREHVAQSTKYNVPAAEMLRLAAEKVVSRELNERARITFRLPSGMIWE